MLSADILDKLQTLCTSLRNTEEFKAQGFEVPKGALLYGPPGTGKTQIARTLANESGLPFIAATTADMKAGFVGQSGQKVRELFERARPRARSNSSRTFWPDWPTKPAFMSAVVAAMKGSPLSFANVRAICVFPVPGGPYNSAPFGTSNPCALNSSVLRNDVQSVCSLSRMSAESTRESHRAPSSTDSLLAFVCRLRTSRHMSSVITPPFLVASVHTSLATLERFLPDIPVVACPRKSGTSTARSSFAISSRMICSRSGAPGRPISTAAPKRETIASSSRSRRFVAPTTHICWASVPSPSHSARNACTSSSELESELVPPRRANTPSHSSMKMTHRPRPRACSHTFFTRSPLWPIYPAFRSGPFSDRKKQLAESAIRRAISVFPVPGGPYISSPLGAALSPLLNMRILSRMSDLTAGSRTIFSQILVRSASLTCLPLGLTSRMRSALVNTTLSVFPAAIARDAASPSACSTMPEIARPPMLFVRRASSAAISSASKSVLCFPINSLNSFSRCSRSGFGISMVCLRRERTAGSIASGRLVAASTNT